MAAVAPVDYTSKDYESFKTSMLDYAARIMPEWTSRSEGDFGVMLVELFAYMGEILSYYGDRAAAEAFLPTATQNASLLNLAALVGYSPNGGTPATGIVTLKTLPNVAATTVPKGSQFVVSTPSGTQIFETTEDVVVPANEGTAEVEIVHGQTMSGTLLGTSNGAAGQTFYIPDTPVLPETLAVYSQASGDSVLNWQPVKYFADSGPNDRVYVTRTDSLGRVSLQFGDGVNGAIPATNTSLYADYRIGGGKIGNLAASANIGFASASILGVVVANDTNTGLPMVTATTGGTDADTAEEIRRAIPRAFRTRDRAVTLEDYADIAMSVPRVFKANAVADTMTSVSVYIMDDVGNVTPSQALRDQVLDVLNAKALAGVTVTVAPANTVPINFGTQADPLEIEAYPYASNSAVQFAVMDAIKQFFAPTNTSFAQKITISDIYRAVMSVEGVRYLTIPMMVRADTVQSGTADILLQAWEIPTLGDLFLQVTGGAA